MHGTKIWNISLPPEMARTAEKIAKTEAHTKSELVREALRQYLWGRRWKELRSYGEERAREKGINTAFICNPKWLGLQYVLRRTL